MWYSSSSVGHATIFLAQARSLMPSFCRHESWSLSARVAMNISEGIRESILESGIIILSRHSNIRTHHEAIDQQPPLRRRRNAADYLLHDCQFEVDASMMRMLSMREIKVKYFCRRRWCRAIMIYLMSLIDECIWRCSSMASAAPHQISRSSNKELGKAVNCSGKLMPDLQCPGVKAIYQRTSSKVKTIWNFAFVSCGQLACDRPKIGWLFLSSNKSASDPSCDV